MISIAINTGVLLWLGILPEIRKPNPNPKNSSPRSPNTTSGSKPRYPKLLRVNRVLNPGTRILKKTRNSAQQPKYATIQPKYAMFQPSPQVTFICFNPNPTHGTTITTPPVHHQAGRRSRPLTAAHLAADAKATQQECATATASPWPRLPHQGAACSSSSSLSASGVRRRCELVQACCEQACSGEHGASPAADQEDGTAPTTEEQHTS